MILTKPRGFVSQPRVVIASHRLPFALRVGGNVVSGSASRRPRLYLLEEGFDCGILVSITRMDTWRMGAQVGVNSHSDGPPIPLQGTLDQITQEMLAQIDSRLCLLPRQILCIQRWW
jgi:hypothetical protein